LCAIGSGARDEDFQQAIKAGMIIAYVNTETRLHGAAALRMSLQTRPQDRALRNIAGGGPANEFFSRPLQRRL
jgi:fructose/tagatose bisphosphate aldolase